MSPSNQPGMSRNYLVAFDGNRMIELFYRAKDFLSARALL